MTEDLRIARDHPPPRGDLHQYIGAEAAGLTAEFLRLRKKKGKNARRQELIVKQWALDLLSHYSVPLSLVGVFDTMLGDVAHSLAALSPDRPWIDFAAQFEAREDREINTSEIVDRVVMPARPSVSNRQGVLKEVRAVRKESWYRWRVNHFRLALIDGEKK